MSMATKVTKDDGEQATLRNAIEAIPGDYGRPHTGPRLAKAGRALDRAGVPAQQVYDTLYESFWAAADCFGA